MIFRWQFFPPVEPNNAISFWFALNAPVLLFVRFAQRIAAVPAVSPYIVGGPRPIYFIVLILGLGLWFLVGRGLDKLLRRGTRVPSTISVRNLILYLVAIACGIRLIFIGLEWILPRYSGERHPLAEITNSCLILVWALTLILFPAIKLLHLARNRTDATEIKPVS